jgi:medium-chain acyl-[acyl-carrier-protein] hydrolase
MNGIANVAARGEVRLSPASSIYRPKPRTNPVLRLFCFPYAGAGAAAYRLWPNHLSDDIEVVAIHPPGRAHRLLERPLTRIDAMVENALTCLTPLMDKPFAVFGHSLGAIVAAEFARNLQAHGRSASHLFISSRPPRREPTELLHQLPDDDFVAAMNARYNGIPSEILAQPDLLTLLLPALRADIEALETFRPHHDRPKIACLTTVYGGESDLTVSHSDLAGWSQETNEPCRIRMFPGDHFYLNTGMEAMLADLSMTLSLALAKVHEKRDGFG